MKELRNVKKIDSKTWKIQTTRKTYVEVGEYVKFILSSVKMLVEFRLFREWFYGELLW